MCIMAAIPHIMGATTHVVFAGGQGTWGTHKCPKGTPQPYKLKKTLVYT